jgi:trypsin
MLKWVGLVGVGLLVSACGAPDPELELGSARQAIVNGEPSDETDDAAVYVLTRVSNSDRIFCTGSLVAPNLVVTALHCITHTVEGNFSCRSDGTIDSNTAGDGTIGQLVTPSSVGIYLGTMPGSEPDALGARLIGTGTTQICKNDLGLVILDRALDAPILPLRLETTVTVGEQARIVGYGQTETSGTSGRFRRGGRRIVDVGPETDSEPVTNAAPRTFVMNEGPCHGDSGGPAISEETGALLGVYSLAAASSCTNLGVRNVFTRLAPFSSLILAAFDAAGAEPELEVDPTPPRRAPESKGCALSAAAPSGAGGWLALLGGIAGVWLARRRR